jgi:CspA family cold shock protein
VSIEIVDRWLDDIPSIAGISSAVAAVVVSKGAGAAMTDRGRVRRYSVDEGWGIIESDATPGGCLVQVLSIHTASGTLTAGEEVDLGSEPLPTGVEEESFRFAALSVRPAGSDVEPPAVAADRPRFTGRSWTSKS